MTAKPRFFIFLIFLAVLCLPPANALDDTARESDSDFITIYLHGWSDAIAGDDDIDFYEPRGFEPARERAEIFGQRNIMHYQFSNMADYDRDAFIRET
jgi:hypothetical protein